MPRKIKAKEVIDLIEQMAPLSLAETWDNSGWQTGDPQQSVRRVVVALDFTREVLIVAEREKAELIIPHHPFIFKPLRALRYDQPAGALLRDLVQAGISLYSAHTNLDNAATGVSQVLANKLGLQETQVLGISQREKLIKLVVFIPAGHEDAVRQAVSAAGAGWIGNYSHCTFQTEGTGTFLPLKGAAPYLGRTGQLEKAAEYRLETVVPERLVKPVVQAMLTAHPYEEVAYDLYPLQLAGPGYGPGRIGKLANPGKLSSLAEQVKSVLQLPILRTYGHPGQWIERAAVCGGSGAFLIPEAAAQGAQVLITGDVKYHEVQEAHDLGLAVIEAGHGPTEFPAIECLTAYLQEKMPAVSFKTAEPSWPDFWL